MFDSIAKAGGEMDHQRVGESNVGGDAETGQFTDRGAIPAVTPFSEPATTPTASDHAYGTAGGSDEMGERLVDTDAEFDVPAAEEYNREHVVDVVRFDRATHGQFARGDGQLDARRIAAWQKKHHLPENGRVTENSCLVAEGKPPLPANNEPHTGAPMLLIEHPRGETFALGARIPLTVSVAGPPGPVQLHVQVAGEVGRDVEVELGYDGQTTVDLPFDAAPLPGTRDIAVSGTIGGEYVEMHSPFDLAATGILPPTHLGPDPSLPGPASDRHAIDQAKAEQFNRENVANVVRFDRATHGYFAKPNGELDALAVAEWQTEHGISRSGMVDELTVKAAETEHGGLDPEPDPRTFEHGGPEFKILKPDNPNSIDPTSPLIIDVATRGDVPVEADWAIVQGSNVIEMGRAGSVTNSRGSALIVDTINKGTASMNPPRDATLQIEVTSPLGTSPVQAEAVHLESKPKIMPAAD